MLMPDLNFIYKYFHGEKQESLLFLIIGVIAIMLAVIFLVFIKSNIAFYRGAAIPLLAIGIIQCAVGYTVFSRADKQVKDIAYNIGIEPVNYVNQTEMPRMKTVMKNFVIFRWVEIGFIVAGFILIMLFREKPERAFWYGLGIALTIQALLMLGADFFAEQRGKVYVEGLKGII
jgi:hypothetical protein